MRRISGRYALSVTIDVLEGQEKSYVRPVCVKNKRSSPIRTSNYNVVHAGCSCSFDPPRVSLLSSGSVDTKSLDSDLTCSAVLPLNDFV